ncbi:MAG: hypothetical protein J6K29_00310 [Clostridia bacterium]|nr:hypothetical protein [Clostridia bacterium]
MSELLDFHAHILPHMDHGSRHTETATAQLSLMAKAGVGTVCATSHFYPQDILPEVFLEERQKSLQLLLRAHGKANRPEILLGAEVLICAGLENMEGLRELCVEGTDVLLLEMPFTKDDWDHSLYHTVHEILMQGIRPVLAHVDRYPPHAIEQMFDMGLYGQVNCDALSKLFKPKHLLRWMEEGKIVALGSDLHGAEEKAYTPFTKVLRTMPEQSERIMRTAHTLLKQAKRY